MIFNRPLSDGYQLGNTMKITKYIAVSSLLLGSLLFTGNSLADELRIPVGQQAPEKQGLEKPKQGITKAQVESKFGEPLEWTDPVGDPPISSWEYQNYVVFFEFDRVLHSVLKSNGRPVAD